MEYQNILKKSFSQHSQKANTRAVLELNQMKYKFHMMKQLIKNLM